MKCLNIFEGEICGADIPPNSKLKFCEFCGGDVDPSIIRCGTVQSISSGVCSKKAEFAEVCFHIIVSPTLLHDAEKGDVHVSFQSSTLGGWKCREHKLNFKSIHEFHADGYLEYEGVVKIPKQILGTRLYYCYYVVKNGNEVIEEYIYCHSSQANHRTLSVEHGIVRDTIHQFDGVIKDKEEKDKNKGLMKTVKGLLGLDEYKKELKKEAAFAFRALAPQVLMSMKETTGVTGEEIIFYVESLLEGLDSAYRVTAVLWYTGREFLSYMSKVCGRNSHYYTGYKEVEVYSYTCII